SGPRRDVVRREIRAAAATRRWSLAHREARKADGGVGRDLPWRRAASGTLDGQDRHEREPGGPGVPRRLQPPHRLPPGLTQGGRGRSTLPAVPVLPRGLSVQGELVQPAFLALVVAVPCE